MSASVNDRITDTRNGARPNSARATGTRAAGATSLACDSLSGWPTASKVHFVTYQIDTSSNPVSGTQLDCYGIVSGNSITSFTVVDGTDNGNSANDVVEMLPTAAWGQGLSDGILTQHNRDGTHSVITATSLNTTGNVTVGANATVAGTFGVIGVATFTAVPAFPNSTITTAEIQAGAVTNAKLDTTAGGPGGAWASWTPSWTNLTVGNGTNTSKYMQVGKTVIARVEFVLGTTSSVATAPTFTLPVTSISGYVVGDVLGSLRLKSGGAGFLGTAQWASTTTALVTTYGAGGSSVSDSSITSTVPGTWTTSDHLVGTFIYEAA